MGEPGLLPRRKEKKGEPLLNKAEQREVVEQITEKLYDEFCSEGSDLHEMETEHAEAILAATTQDEWNDAADAFERELEEKFPFAMMKGINLDQNAVKKKKDADGWYMIIDRKKLRAQIEKAVKKAVKSVLDTASVVSQKKAEGQRKVMSDEIKVGFEGASAFNGALIGELEKQMAEKLGERGVAFNIKEERTFTAKKVLTLAARIEPTEFQT